MKRLHTVIVSTIVFALAATGALAVEAPQLINYQGVLRDASDAPQSGDFDMEFRFFDSDGGASCPTSDGLLLIADRHQGAGTVLSAEVGVALDVVTSRSHEDSLHGVWPIEQFRASLSQQHAGSGDGRGCETGSATEINDCRARNGV